MGAITSSTSKGQRKIQKAWGVSKTAATTTATTKDQTSSSLNKMMIMLAMKNLAN